MRDGPGVPGRWDQALFGAPIAMENAAQRAVSSALAIHQKVTKLSHQIQEETRGPAIRMRIGIHTGPVVLGTIGSDLRLEFQVIGDTVNLADRLECLAEPGTTYVSEETFKLNEGFFRFEALGKRRIKGKQSPMEVFRVICSSPLRSRFDQCLGDNYGCGHQVNFGVEINFLEPSSRVENRRKGEKLIPGKCLTYAKLLINSFRRFKYRILDKGWLR